MVSRGVDPMHPRLAPADAARNHAHPRGGIGLSTAPAWGNRVLMCGYLASSRSNGARSLRAAGSRRAHKPAQCLRRANHSGHGNRRGSCPSPRPQHGGPGHIPPAMRVFDDRVEATPLWTARWGLGVPAALEQPDRPHVGRVRVWPGAGPARGRPTRPRRPTRSRRSGRYRDHEWIVNSRNDADVARPDRSDPRAPRVARPPRPRRAALLRAAAAPLTIVLDSLCGGAC